MASLSPAGRDAPEDGAVPVGTSRPAAHQRLTRRSMLAWLPAAAGAGAGAGIVTTALLHARPTGGRGDEARMASRSPMPPHHDEHENAQPSRFHAAMRRPLRTLADYRTAVPGPAFPANAIALTIDDGPHPIWTPRILRLLDRYHVPALFCMIGNQVLGHESLARSVVQAGHHVANHTWSHPTSCAQQPFTEMHRQLTRTQDKIYSATGYTPTLFRPPGGGWSATLAATTADTDLLPIDWSDDPRDWARPGAARIVRRLLAARPGQILLCHDGGGDRSQTLTALTTVIPALHARGLRFVALDGRN